MTLLVTIPYIDFTQFPSGIPSTGGSEITGGFTFASATQLANVLASGALPLNLVVVLIFALAEGVRPMWSWFELPLILLMLTVLTTGVSMLVSALFVRFRDISPIWEVLSQILFYSAPVILPAEIVREKLAHGTLDHVLYHLYTLNPLVAIFQQFRHTMINHATLGAEGIMGSWLALLEPTAIVAAIFVVGFWYFNREAPHIAEDL